MQSCFWITRVFQKAGENCTPGIGRMGSGFRTANTTGHDGGPWALDASPLAGTGRSAAAQAALDVVKIAPAGGLQAVQAQVIFHLPSSDRYIAYRWKK